MTDKREIEQKFWKSIRSDMTAMFGIDGDDARPMTAQFDGDSKTIYFFTAKDTELPPKLKRARKATLIYAAKGHGVFATVKGTLGVYNDRPTIDRLWNGFVAAWFEKGKDDPKLALLRFEPGEAQIWIDASSMMAGIKMFLGIDPKEDYKDKVATVQLG